MNSFNDPNDHNEKYFLMGVMAGISIMLVVFGGILYLMAGQ